jgi:glycerate-2-kinase
VNAPSAAARDFLRECFAAGLRAVDGERAVASCLLRHGAAIRVGALPERFGVRAASAHVLACGKAAVAMARGWHARAGAPAAGLAIAREPGELPPPWRVRVGGHPLPDEASAAAGRNALAFAAAVPADADLVALLSGGASSLLSTPLAGLTLADLRATTELLLRSGAEIGELNGVRKHLTAASGGRVAAAMGARVAVVILLSDVLGDDFATIGSGPFAADPTRFADAIATLQRRGVWQRAPESVRGHLARGAAGAIAETPKPGDECFSRVGHHVAANNAAAIRALVAHAERRGAVVCTDAEPVRGEARDVGARLVREALAELQRLRPDVGRAALWVRGGETTVTVHGAGRGGRCQELALGAALALDGTPGITLLAAGTDGSDGPTDAAGAFADGGTVARGRAVGVDALAALAANDAYGFFAREGGLFATGPTGTNTLDLVLVLAEARS